LHWAKKVHSFSISSMAVTLPTLSVYKQLHTHTHTHKLGTSLPNLQFLKVKVRKWIVQSQMDSSAGFKFKFELVSEFLVFSHLSRNNESNSFWIHIHLFLLFLYFIYQGIIACWLISCASETDCLVSSEPHHFTFEKNQNLEIKC
jgi:hypothetical protein